MTNQSTKSWSVVVPVSGRCWLNTRHALRNSSEGLYLKKKINSYIYICISLHLDKKKKSPTLTFTLIFHFHFSATQTSKLGNFSGSGAFLRNTEWIQPPVEQGWLLNRADFWTLLKNEPSIFPFGSCCFQGMRSNHQSILGGHGPHCNSWHAGKGRVIFLTLEQKFSAWVT